MSTNSGFNLNYEKRNAIALSVYKSCTVKLHKNKEMVTPTSFSNMRQSTNKDSWNKNELEKRYLSSFFIYGLIVFTTLNLGELNRAMKIMIELNEKFLDTFSRFVPLK